MKVSTLMDCRSTRVFRPKIPDLEIEGKKEENMMQFTQPDSEFNLMIGKAIHNNVITRHEFQKIMTLSGKDLKIEAHEKRLLYQLQGLMENRSTRDLP